MPSSDVAVSTVPGPRLPLYFNGARVLGIHPVVPLNPANQGMNVGVFTYNGALHWGINADRNLTPPVERAADALRHALDELKALS